MSETPGKLRILGHLGTAIWSDNTIIASMANSRTHHANARADARRLVACWNYFDGLSTDFIEKAQENDDTVIEILERDLNEAVGLLRELVRLKELHNRIESPEWSSLEFSVRREMDFDYHTGKPKAWDAARAFLARMK